MLPFSGLRRGCRSRQIGGLFYKMGGWYIEPADRQTTRIPRCPAGCDHEHPRLFVGDLQHLPPGRLAGSSGPSQRVSHPGQLRRHRRFRRGGCSSRGSLREVREPHRAPSRPGHRQRHRRARGPVPEDHRGR